MFIGRRRGLPDLQAANGGPHPPRTHAELESPQLLAISRDEGALAERLNALRQTKATLDERARVCLGRERMREERVRGKLRKLQTQVKIQCAC